MEIIDEIKEKIEDYTVGDDYEPLMVSFRVKPPIYLTSPWIHFDGLLNYLCLRDCLGELFYTLPSHFTINTDNLGLPLKSTECEGKKVYHSSVGLYHQSKLMTDTIYKRFTDKETFHLTKKQQRGRIHTDRGHFKDFMIRFPILLTDTITFYCNGDKKELERLLPHLTMLGKKTSIGSGQILNTYIKSVDEDHSFYYDGKIMRPIPSNFKLPLVPGMTMQRQSYKPPYWEKDNMTMCYVPPNQILEEGID